MKYALFMVMVFGLLAMGCQSEDYSQNMRVATVRATAGVATKIILDEVALDKYVTAKKLTVEIAQDLKLFCDNGKLADLPFDIVENKVVTYMQSKGWDSYIPLITGILSIVETQKVSVEKLGEDNLYLIKTGLDEVIESANSSKAEWRRPPNLQ